MSGEQRHGEASSGRDNLQVLLRRVRVPKAAETGTAERRAALYRVRAITRRWISFVPS